MVLATPFYSCFLVPSCLGDPTMAEKPAIQVKVRMPKSLHRKLMRDASGWAKH